MRKKLRQLRTELGYTQASFGKVVKASTTHYSQIEQGIKWPSLRLALRIKQALGYPGDDLFDNVPTEDAK